MLLTASGSERLSIMGDSSFEPKIGNLVTVEKFLVVKNLVSPLILGTELLTKHKMVVDFSENLVKGEKIGAVPMTSRGKGYHVQHVKYTKQNGKLLKDIVL